MIDGWSWLRGLSSQFSHEGAECHAVGEHFLHEVLRLHRDPRRVAGHHARHRRVLLEVLAVPGLLGGEEKRGGKADFLLWSHQVFINSSLTLSLSLPFQDLFWFH